MKSIHIISSARALATSGRLHEAECILRGALESEPGSVPLLQELGDVLRRSGRARDAVESLSRAARIKPDSVPLLLDLARVLGEVGQFAPAVEVAERATRLAPANGQAWRTLGTSLHMMGRMPQADAALARAEHLLPRDAQVKQLRAAGLHAAGRPHEALELARKAVAIRREPNELATLGMALLSMGQTDESIAAFDEALAGAPDHADAISGKARAAESQGNRGLAIETLGPIVRGPSCTNALLAQYAALCARSPDRAAVIDLCRARLRDFSGNPTSTIQLRMALGALLEAEGDYAGAFDSYLAGKACYPQTFNAADHTRRVRDLEDSFSARAMAALPRSTHSEPRPVFIVGMPRSGTTLLEQIIAGHPRATGIGERWEMLSMVESLARRLGTNTPFPRCVEKITTGVLDAIASDYMAMLDHQAPGKDRVVDKMPHNFLALGLIALALPSATLIHSVRHPLDTCVSCLATPLPFAHDYSVSLENLVVAYRAYRELMAHWKAVLGERLVEATYETLVADPETESRRLIAATRLEWDPACLKFYEGKRSVVTASASQVRRPMYDSSIGRWKKFEPYLGVLIDGLREFL